MEQEISALRKILTPLVAWCVRLGIGYRQLCQLLKPLFYHAAVDELANQAAKTTDMQISLASGLHRADVVLFRSMGLVSMTEDQLGHDRISPTVQILTRWLAQGLPETIPAYGERGSFESIVRQCCAGRSTVWSVNLMLQELSRQGRISSDQQSVSLLARPLATDSKSRVTYFANAVSDHIEACIANLASNDPRFIEQSIEADGLHSSSIQVLNQSAYDWWQEALRAITAQAIELSDKDETNGGDQRLRLGVYMYFQPMSGIDMYFQSAPGIAAHQSTNLEQTK